MSAGGGPWDAGGGDRLLSRVGSVGGFACSGGAAPVPALSGALGKIQLPLERFLVHCFNILSRPQVGLFV